MKNIRLLPMIAVMLLAGCAQLNSEDRAFIHSTGKSASEARDLSAQAAEDARQARASAEKAAADAEVARQSAEKSAEKSDRIFRQGQNK